MGLSTDPTKSALRLMLRALLVLDALHNLLYHANIRARVVIAVKCAVNISGVCTGTRQKIGTSENSIPKITDVTAIRIMSES